MMEIRVSFPGGKKVDAAIGGFTIHTDQPADAGGEGTAPSPFVLFLASLATCAGFYVLSFCQQRDIDTAGISLTQRMEFGETAEGKKRVQKVVVEIALPASFPEKYRNAVVKAAQTCTVKKAITDPPEFDIVATVY